MSKSLASAKSTRYLLASGFMAMLPLSASSAVIDIYDSRTGELLKSTEDTEVVVPYKEQLSISVIPDKASDKMRLEPQNSDCGTGRQFDSAAPFQFTLDPMSQNSTCEFRVVSWNNPWNWNGSKKYQISFTDSGSNPDPITPTPPSVADKVVWTVGTARESDYEVGPVVARSRHGNRVYCTVSHFSYDDPILYPGQVGRAHLHMFYGNTDTNAYSTPTSIPSTGKSTCLGGTNYRSGVWTPALFNDRDEVVIPNTTYIYYKTFMRQSYNQLQVIPQGIEMLASKDTLNFRSRNVRYERGLRGGEPTLTLSLGFPSCVATTNGQRTGTPILSYKNMPGAKSSQVNSHVAYPGGPNVNSVGCPASHPYRFPMPELILNYAEAAVGANPYVSSDKMSGAAAMSTLHADYIFGVDPQVNQQILRCVKESRSCSFGRPGALPERFLSEDGTQLYQSNKLLPSVDKTPFGNTLKPMKMH